jgi:hypothetical protein
MVKVLIVHPDLYNSKKDTQLLNSISNSVITINYTQTMVADDVLKLIGSNIHDVTHFSFMYHYPGFDRLPFFNIIKTDDEKYNYFSNAVIDLIKSVRDSSS